MALSQDQINAQVQAAGYNGPMDPASVNAAYARAATPSDLASSGINTQQFATPGTNPNPGPATNNPYTMNMPGLAQFGAQTSGVTQAQLAQQKQEFDAQLAFAQQQMQQLGIPQLQINQQLAQLQQQQFQAQLSQLYGYQLPGGNAPAAGTPTQAAQAQQAGLSGYYGGLAPGQLTWNQLSNQLQSLGGGYNDAAAKARYASLMGLPANFNGSTPINLSQQQINSIAQAGGVDPTAVQGAATMALQAQNAQLYGQAGTPQPGQQTLASQLQAFNEALAAAGQTGTYQGQQTQAAQLQAANIAAQQAGLTGWYNAPGAAGGGATAGAGGGQGQQTLAGQLQQAQLTGMYQGAPTEAASEFSRNLALQQGQLGQQYLATAAQLQGPQNTFQLSNYMRGAQGNAAVPTYLQNLASNTGQAAFQGTGSTAPTVQSAAGLTGQMTGQQSATPGWDYNQTLNTMNQIQNRGAQGLRPGTLEGLTPDELAAFGSGLGAVGGSLPSFLQQYQQSRVGQSATPQTALA